jgi:hypothetical protein
LGARAASGASATGTAHRRSYTQANRKPPKPGSWERKLFFGPAPAGALGPRSALRRDGKPVLDLIVTASNEHFPEPDWKQ